MTVSGNRDPRLLIVDDSKIHREALACHCAPNDTDVRVAWDLPSLCHKLEQGYPEVILLNMRSCNSTMLLRAIAETAPEVPVIALGLSEDDEAQIVECAEVGVAGYHLKSQSLGELMAMVRKVAEGESICSPRTSGIILRRLSTLASRRQPATQEVALTAREKEILEMLAMGLSNREIASRLCIAVHTVKNHVHSILAKLGVRSRAEAVARAGSLRSAPPLQPVIGHELAALRDLA